MDTCMSGPGTSLLELIEEDTTKDAHKLDGASRPHPLFELGALKGTYISSQGIIVEVAFHEVSSDLPFLSEYLCSKTLLIRKGDPRLRAVFSAQEQIKLNRNFERDGSGLKHNPEYSVLYWRRRDAEDQRSFIVPSVNLNNLVEPVANNPETIHRDLLRARKFVPPFKSEVTQVLDAVWGVIVDARKNGKVIKRDEERYIYYSPKIYELFAAED